MRSTEALPQLARVMAAGPALFLQHVDAYGSLFVEELERWGDACQRRAALIAIAASGLLVSSLLAGVALIVYASTAALEPERIWVFVLVPAAPLLMALGALTIAHAAPPMHAFAELRRQANADLELLKELAAA